MNCPDATEQSPTSVASPSGAEAAAASRAPEMIMDCKAKVTSCRTVGQISFVSTSGSVVRAHSWRTGKLWKLFRGHSGPVSALALSRDRSYFYSGGWDRQVLRWHVPSKTAVSFEDVIGSGTAHGDFVKALLLSPDEEVLFSGGADGSLLAWGLSGLPAAEGAEAGTAQGAAEGEVAGMRRASPPHAALALHSRSIYDICNLPCPAVKAAGGEEVGLVATASSDNTVRIVAYARGTEGVGGAPASPAPAVAPRLCCVFAFHQGFETSVQHVAFSGGLLWTAARDSHVRGFSLPDWIFDSPLDLSRPFVLAPLDKDAVEGNRAMEGEMQPEVDVLVPSTINGWSLDPYLPVQKRPESFLVACDDKWVYEVCPAAGSASRKYGPFLSGVSTVQCVLQPMADPSSGEVSDCPMVVAGGLDNSLRRFFANPADRERYLHAEDSSDIDLEDSDGIDPEVERLQQERLLAMLRRDGCACGQ